MAKNKKPFGYWFGLIYTLLTVTATIVLSILKLVGVVTTPWWVVTMPVWASLGFAFMCLCFVFFWIKVYGDKVEEL